MKLIRLLFAFVLCFTQWSFARHVMLEPRQSQDLNVKLTVTDKQFKSFENPNTLRQYLKSQGYDFDLNYKQLSDYVTDVNDYFASRLSGTSPKKMLARAESNILTPNAAQDDSPIKTHTNSTTLKGGPSYTNVTLSANATYVEALSFSDGNAASSGGAIQRGTTVSSTASSGMSNSTGTVTGNKNVIRILVNSTVASSENEQIVNAGQDDALSAAACSARATGASSSASIVTRLVYPVNMTGMPTIGSVSKSFCEAGVRALENGTPGGTSSAGSQSSLTQGVQAEVECNGVLKSNTAPRVMFALAFEGTYSESAGLKGRFTGSRTSSNSISCS